MGDGRRDEEKIIKTKKVNNEKGKCESCRRMMKIENGGKEGEGRKSKRKKGRTSKYYRGDCRLKNEVVSRRKGVSRKLIRR